MTKEEAIYLLRNTAWLAPSENYESVEEAVGMATEALKERPRGKWVERNSYVVCSVCEMPSHTVYVMNLNKYIPVKTKFCPNCGADMRGEKDD